MNRKQFFKAAGRTALLGGMALMTFSFFQRDKITSSAKCTDTGFCRACPKLRGCREEAALKVRKDEKG